MTPILRTWVQKSTLLLQNRGHAEVLKKDPFFREIRNAGATPLCAWVPPPGSSVAWAYSVTTLSFKPMLYMSAAICFHPWQGFAWAKVFKISAAIRGCPAEEILWGASQTLPQCFRSDPQSFKSIDTAHTEYYPQSHNGRTSKGCYQLSYRILMDCTSLLPLIILSSQLLPYILRNLNVWETVHFGKTLDLFNKQIWLQTFLVMCYFYWQRPLPIFAEYLDTSP